MNKPFLLTVLGFFFSHVYAQQTPFDCSILWQKMQESNHYSARGAVNSEDYFFREYIHCLEANGDSVTLSKWRHTVGLSAFSGGYAFKETRWYSAVIDSNFNELSRTTNLNAKFIGLGFYTEEQFGKLVLYDAFGKQLITPKYYDQINVMKSHQTGETVFIGETGLTVNAFNAQGEILKTWEGISETEVRFDHVLLLKRGLPGTTPDNHWGNSLYAIYSGDLDELMPLTEGKMRNVGDFFIFESRKYDAFIFDKNGRLKCHQLNVQNLDGNFEFILVSEVNGNWQRFDQGKGVFDSLIPNKTLNDLNYTITVHPDNNQGKLIRNAKQEVVFDKPVTYLIQRDENWFEVFENPTSWLWNPKTNQKLKFPKTYAEAKALSVEANTQQPTTEYPFFCRFVRVTDEQNRIKSKHLIIYESHSYTPTGEPKDVVRQDYRWSFTTAHVTLKNGWCFNYSKLNELVDSFRADGVYELIQSRDDLIQYNPEFVPLSYSLNGKRGVFYLGSNVHSEAKYDELIADGNSIYYFSVKLNDRFGVVDVNGKPIVPITYSSVYIEEKGNISAILNSDQRRQKNALYLFNSLLPTELDSTYHFVRSTKQQLVLKHAVSQPANEYTSAFEHVNHKLLPFSGEVYEEYSYGVYTKLSSSDSGSLYFDATFHPIMKGEVYEFHNLPCGCFVVGNATSIGIGYYSFKRKTFKQSDLSFFSGGGGSAIQLIGRKDDDYFLIGTNCKKVKLPQGYKYKITNYDGLVYYAFPANESLWGLMKVDGTKITEPLFEDAYEFKGEHGMVWSKMKNYYIDKTGKTIAMF